MKVSLIILSLLVTLFLPQIVQAQAAKAPPRGTARKTIAPKPINAAPDRTNSTALPSKPAPVVTSKPAPQPPIATRPQPVQRTQYANKNGSVGGSPGGGGERVYGFGRGTNLLNVGVGLSSYYYGNPIGISYEAGIDKDFSIGAQFDYNSGDYGDYYYYSSRWRYTSTYFGIRGSYHVNRLIGIRSSKVDLYAGLGLGYRTFRWNDSNYGSGFDYNSGLFFNYYVGGKYYFNNKIGAFLELGYTGLSSSRVGLAVKF